MKWSKKTVRKTIKQQKKWIVVSRGEKERWVKIEN